MSFLLNLFSMEVSPLYVCLRPFFLLFLTHSSPTGLYFHSPPPLDFFFFFHFLIISFHYLFFLFSAFHISLTLSTLSISFLLVQHILYSFAVAPLLQQYLHHLLHKTNSQHISTTTPTTKKQWRQCTAPITTQAAHGQALKTFTRTH